MDLLQNHESFILSNDNYSDQWELSILPEELWAKILLNMNYSTMKRFSSTNKYMNNLYIKSRKLLVSKFSEDRFNTSNFNEKIKLIKKRMIYKNGKYLIINYNGYYITICEKSQEMKFLEFLEYNYIKTEDDSVFKLEIKDESLSDLKSKIENMLYITYDETKSSNERDEEYRGVNNLNIQNHDLPFNILQLYENLCLSDDGDIYVVYRSWNSETPERPKIIEGLDKIREIIWGQGLLSVNGDIYRKSDGIFLFDKRFSNIIKVHIRCIAPHGDILYYLDNKGNIMREHSYDGSDDSNDSNDYTIIETGKNIIEISTSRKFLYALDDNMKLYIYFNEKLIKEYDLLDL